MEQSVFTGALKFWADHRKFILPKALSRYEVHYKGLSNPSENDCTASGHARQKWVQPKGIVQIDTDAELISIRTSQKPLDLHGYTKNFGNKAICGADKRDHNKLAVIKLEEV